MPIALARYAAVPEAAKRRGYTSVTTVACAPSPSTPGLHCESGIITGFAGMPYCHCVAATASDAFFLHFS